MRIGAFFDVDDTILSKSSGTLYTRFMIREGKAGWTQMLKTMWWYARYKMGRLDIQKMTRKVSMYIAGTTEAEMIADCNRWYAEMVRQYVRPQMVEKIEWHRSQGHNIALLTAATIYLARPLGEDLRVDGYICNRLEVKDGVFTGRMVEPLCSEGGKALHAERYATGQDIDLAQSYFYTDSITDIDFLLHVGHPVAVNPDPLLRREAKRRNWPILDFPRPRR